MIDEHGNETEEPKRRYQRRKVTGIEKVDDIINDFAEKVSADEDTEVEVGLEFDGEVVEAPAEEQSPPKLLFTEPVDNSLKAKIERALNVNNPMVFKPWRGLDHWACTKCKFTTFKAEVAKGHRCA